MLLRHLWITLLFHSCAALTHPLSARAASQDPPVRVNWEVQRQLTIGGDQPVYPALASMAQIYGAVHVEFTVKTDGTTKDVTVWRGHPLLMHSVIDAVLTWRFKPVAVNGVPRETQTLTVVNFFRRGETLSSHLKKFVEAVAKKPTDAKARENLARELLEVGQFQESVDEFRKVVSSNPKVGALRFGLGEALGKNGEVYAAIEEYRQGLLLSPKDMDARTALARWLERSGDLDSAISELRSILQSAPKAFDPRFRLARVLMKKGEVDAAITEYQQVLRSVTRFPDAHYGLGEALEKKGDVNGALKEYEKAVDILPVSQIFREARDRLLKQTPSR